MKKNQKNAPIVEAIKQYQNSGITPFTTPGHKMGTSVFQEDKIALGPDPYFNDVTMQNGADDRKESKKVQDTAEQLMADAIGADKSMFSTNGSSLSIHVAILSVSNVAEKVLVVRNTHKSMIAALIMADVIPVFLQPEIDEELDIEHGITPTHLEEMLQIHKDAKAVVIVSPTYYGVVSDVKALAEITHKYKIPLIVDEAWGPHFPFSKQLPSSAISCGADMSLGSIHKTMNGLSQTSIVSIKSDLIDKDRFSLCFDLYESTSPSSLMLATIDIARRQMVLHGEELWGNALALARKARNQLKKIKGLFVLDRSILKKKGTFDLDETKLVLDVSGLGVTGYNAADWMLENFKITFELITQRNLMAFIGTGDTEDTVKLLIEAITAMCEWAKKSKPKTYLPLPHHNDLGTELVMLPSKAFFGPTKTVALEKAEGEIIAEMVSPYPPGIPRLIPGERITGNIVEFLKKGKESGQFVLDPADQSLKKLRVVKLH